ncbi:ABC transporter permease [Acidiplasma cupricumulans]|uniref:Peptide ABC transporter permease n=1 Tax=Acidiplasma cupricumulans TaxID=312540 RepID=A0A0Q0RR97_9ARCH|nr:ABC transporter permease [Acidiplasma cupricumulans]KQB34872.1 peptide ABC transporter permease [Acidiplasma cupricumulans]
MNTNLVLYIIRRAIYALVTLIFIIVIVFFLIHLIAPTPQAMAGIYAGSGHHTKAEINAIIAKYHLNAPLYTQVLLYIGNIFHGNLGYDPVYHVPEISLIGRFLPRTLELVIPAIIISTFLGLYTGSFGASHRRKIQDHAVKGVYLVTWASPPFFIAIVLQLFFAYDLGLLPSTGIANPVLTPPPDVAAFPILNAIIAGDGAYLLSLIRHMILPVMAIALLSFGVITRITRASMIDAMESDYFKLELMKGVSRDTAVYRTALRNAAIPIVTLLALTFGYAVAGAVVVEDIFDYHGMGWFIVQSIYTLDYIAILSTTVIIAISIIIANLVADILYGIMDPRVRVK